MSASPRIAALPSRALTGVAGPYWRGFLQGLRTQEVETLSPGEARFAALLTPQGRLLHDVIIVGRDDGCAVIANGSVRDAAVALAPANELPALVAALTRKAKHGAGHV